MVASGSLVDEMAPGRVNYQVTGVFSTGVDLRSGANRLKHCVFWLGRARGQQQKDCPTEGNKRLKAQHSLYESQRLN
jgi:hypothetical protein